MRSSLSTLQENAQSLECPYDQILSSHKISHSNLIPTSNQVKVVYLEVANQNQNKWDSSPCPSLIKQFCRANILKTCHRRQNNSSQCFLERQVPTNDKKNTVSVCRSLWLVLYIVCLRDGEKVTIFCDITKPKRQMTASIQVHLPKLLLDPLAWK